MNISSVVFVVREDRSIYSSLQVVIFLSMYCIPMNLIDYDNQTSIMKGGCTYDKGKIAESTVFRLVKRVE